MDVGEFQGSQKAVSDPNPRPAKPCVSMFAKLPNTFVNMIAIDKGVEWFFVIMKSVLIFHSECLFPSTHQMLKIKSTYP